MWLASESWGIAVGSKTELSPGATLKIIISVSGLRRGGFAHCNLGGCKLFRSFADSVLLAVENQIHDNAWDNQKIVTNPKGYVFPGAAIFVIEGHFFGRLFVNLNFAKFRCIGWLPAGFLPGHDHFVASAILALGHLHRVDTANQGDTDKGCG
jgi:hypothetical protein